MADEEEDDDDEGAALGNGACSSTLNGGEFVAVRFAGAAALATAGFAKAGGNPLATTGGLGALGAATSPVGGPLARSLAAIEGAGARGAFTIASSELTFGSDLGTRTVSSNPAFACG